MVENGKKVLKDRKCSPATLYACLKAEDQSFSCSCIHLLTTIMENQYLGKRSSSSATCISFALSSKMCVLILSLMNNNPLLNRKATCHFPQDQSGRHKTQNSCPLADAHLFYKPQRPVLMSIHKSTWTFIGICFHRAFLNNNCKRIKQAQQTLCTECIRSFCANTPVKLCN